MDAFYDNIGAATMLEEIASTRREALAQRTSAGIAHLADIKLDELVVVGTGKQRKDWRLCVLGDDDDELEELVVRLQGILTKNNLVPKNTALCGRSKAKFLSQHAEICGLGTSTFEEALNRLPSVTDKFEQHLAGAELGSIPEAEGLTGRLFSASNRLFTIKSDEPTEQDTAFQLGVDPLNVLQKFKSSELIHAPQNMVKYYKRTEEQGAIAYKETVPGNFKAGDVVELQVSFVAIMTAKTKVKVTARLQAVTLLSNDFSKKASQERIQSVVRASGQTGTRRKVGYFQEDAEDERKVKKRREDAAKDDEMVP